MRAEEGAGPRTFAASVWNRLARRVGAETLSLLAWSLGITSILLGIVLVLAAVLKPISAHGASYDDWQNAHTMIASVLSCESLPVAPDGRIDVYAALASTGAIDADVVHVLFNHRADRGPTVAEVVAGDYRNFAWGRAFARTIPEDGTRVPVLWSEQPYEDGRIVAFSDGAARLVPEEQFQALRAAGER